MMDDWSGGATHCPLCGADLDRSAGFVTEYWEADDRHFVCWCHHCRRLSRVTIPTRLIGHEPEH